MKPKVWTQNEIVALILASMKTTSDDAKAQRIPVRYGDLAEQVYLDLNEKGLIEREP